MQITKTRQHPDFDDKIIVRVIVDTDELVERFRRFRAKLRDGKGLLVDVYG
jgi:hypothetical protein